ncbi:MAG TPA: DUF3244 domain-containing protein, partial [Candidatus Coprenecus merdipullorum]|nr:DUF3244 domain-containing protein [Candidatus Coprenecus merdipullorum]
FPAFSSASCKEDEIEIYRITDATTRSLTALPEASIDAQSGQLSVSFDSGGTCALLVEDSLGVPVYTSTLPADGMGYSYDLSGIGEGMFRLVIEGPGGEYEGYFSIY